MRVLWFEITEPSAYKTGGAPIGGWQDSLERIVRTVQDIELTIAFLSEKYNEVKKVNNVTYVPIYVHWNVIERRFGRYWDAYVKKMLPGARKVIEETKPDLIQVFGTEWHFGQIATLTKIPVVIHIMGAIIPYNNAVYPPRYSYEGLLYKHRWNLLKTIQLRLTDRNRKDWEKWERKTWNVVENYMGRTHWDEALSRVMHPGRKYYHVDEALREDFLSDNNKWCLPVDGKIRLISTGCTTFWKGPDMMLKVARILIELDIDFEWNVVGIMPPSLKRIVECQEGIKYDDCNLKFLGYKKSDELMQLLRTSSIYVHTAYVENSPNSICEAQCLGVPVISTNVGGISSLIRNGIDGELFPANDPWQMADAIIQLSKDKEKMKRFSENSRKIALNRHDDERIKMQLLECYHSLLDNLKTI